MGKLRCPICHSSSWRKEPSSGMLVCGEGHILQGYRKETHEQTEPSHHVMRKRTIKSTRPKDRTRKNRSNPAHYHGARARLLYIQALQLILRLQIQVLREVWCLPKEFENVCRDLWALYLTSLKKDIEVDLDEELPQAKDKGKERPLPRDEELDSSSAAEDSSASESDSGEEEEPVDGSNLAKLIEDISDAESSSPSPRDKVFNLEEALDEEETSTKRTRRRRRSKEQVEPLSTLAILILACWIFRIPVIYMDLIRLVKEYRLPYLDCLKRGLIPESMKGHMNQDVRRLLSPQKTPSVSKLHSFSSSLAFSFSTRFRISIPECNVPHLISRALEALNLPPSLYRLTKLLAQKLEINLNLHPSFGFDAERGYTNNAETDEEDDEGSDKSDPGKTRKKKWRWIKTGDNVPVEAAIVGVVMILLKLLWGLDETPRLVGVEDIALHFPSKEAVLGELKKGQAKSQEDHRKTVLDYTDTELDDYLAFAERALVGVTATQTSSSQPPTISPPPAGQPADPDADMMSAPSSPGTPPIPPFKRGRYLIYLSSDVLGQVPEELEVVLECAARWVGIEVQELLVLIERFERRLVKSEGLKKKEERKRTRLAMEVEMQEDEYDDDP